MKSIITRWLSSESGQSGTLLALIVLGALSYLGQSVYALVWLHQTWEPLSYSSGFAALIGGGAAGLGAHVVLRAGKSGVSTGGAADAGSSQ